MALLVLIPVAILLAAIVFGIFLPKRKRQVKRHGPIALAPFGREERALPPRPTRAPLGADATAVDTPPPTPAEREIPRPVREEIPEREAVEARASEAGEMAAEDRGRVLRLQVAGDRRDVVREDMRNSATLRLERAFDGTLQFLPGRLEIIEGREVGQEIKFVRTQGPDGATLTFGRSSGPLYRHVQLHEATVSRLHARMTLEGKTWSLHNLSATNPVVVNDAPLAGEGSSVVLREGDRIEMGEVVFRFRAK